jgi:hypothetical protein
MNLRGLLALGALLCVVLPAAPSFGQQENTGADYQDVIMNGTTYRLPGAFARGAVAPLPKNVAHALAFGFWLSDGAALLKEFPPIPSRSNQSPNMFWPGERGRPYNSADDFVVQVYWASYADRWNPDMVRALGQRFTSGLRNSDYGLDCSRIETGHVYCITSPDRDPTALFTTINSTEFLLGYAFSSNDRLEVHVGIPMIGLPKWPQVLCQTYALLRTWRQSDGPPPEKCTARLALR